MKIYLKFLALVFVGCAVLIQSSEPATRENDDIDDKDKDKATPINIPYHLSGGISTTRKYCYCFQLKCSVPGISNGFKGWNFTGVHGYVVVNGGLYRFSRCDVTPPPNYKP